MNLTLLALGLFVVGFTFLYLFPASTRANWKEIGRKPAGGELMLLMMRILGLILLLLALAIGTGFFDTETLSVNARASDGVTAP